LSQVAGKTVAEMSADLLAAMAKRNSLKEEPAVRKRPAAAVKEERDEDRD
jgi:hypothetical protein